MFLTKDFWYATKGDHVGSLNNVTDESDIVCVHPSWDGEEGVTLRE